MSRAVNDFKLSDEQNLAIFEGIIVPHFLGDLSPCEEPVAYFTGGQPGAGKSSLQKFIKKTIHLQLWLLKETHSGRFILTLMNYQKQKILLG